MSDIRTVWREHGGDWQLGAGTLAADDGLETAVLLSLFTDRLADEGQAATTADRRGWWGDAYADVVGDRIGSRLWLLARAKQTAEVLGQAQMYARESLQWLVDDGVAASVEVAAEWTRPGVLGLAVTITRSARPVVRYRFDAFWRGD